MKKILVTMLAIAGGTCAFAQQTEKGAYTRPSAIGVSLFFNDYLTPARIRATSFTSVVNNKQIARVREMAPGIAVHYFKGLNNYIDFASSIGGSFPNIVMKNGTTVSDPKFQLEGDASVQVKLFSDRYLFTPYLTAGIGASLYDGTADAIMPLGMGFKFNLFNEAAVFADGTYRVAVTDRMNNNHLVFRVGFAGNLKPRKEKPRVVETPRPPADTDSDGIIDSIDRCPTVPGIAKYQGCPIPDTDKEGINDEEDKCPTVAGIAKYQGCPIPDTDKDGFNDEQDKCPTVAGIAKYQGCPIPDTDNDGINDEEDKCPTLAGVRENNGCPPVKQEVIARATKDASRLFFATGSAKLLKTSDPALNDLAKIMAEEKDLKLYVDGHTDNVGKDEFNQKLSEDRAASVRDALVAKGVDASRIITQGYGETQPVADNKTAAGRAKNRRVVVRPSYE